MLHSCSKEEEPCSVALSCGNDEHNGRRPDSYIEVDMVLVYQGLACQQIQWLLPPILPRGWEPVPRGAGGGCLFMKAGGTLTVVPRNAHASACRGVLWRLHCVSDVPLASLASPLGHHSLGCLELGASLTLPCAG